MTVTVCTPWVDHQELWPDYWDAIYAANPDELIIVDNASSPSLPFATIRLEENCGFCGGSNVALHAASSDIVVFLNNDIQMTDPDWLAELTAAVEPGVLAGAKLRTDPHAWVDGIVMPYLDGWCLAGTRDDLLALGGFDETIEEPGYFSDNLLCLEARAQGFTLREAHVGLRHKGGQTSLGTQNPDVARATRANQLRYEHRVRELTQAAA